MLSQRMTAATCLALSGIDATARAEIAWMSHMEFQQALSGLQNGSEALNLPAESDPAVLEAFAQVEQVWHTVGAAIQQLSSGDLHSVVVNQLTQGNIPLLKTSNAAVTEIVARYGKDVINPDTAKTINIAGRQRMLSQKMMKEACFVAIELGTEEHMDALANTMELFDTSLTQLRQGDAEAGIMAPPKPEIARQLDQVAALWEVYRVGLSLVEPGPRTSPDAMTDLAQQSDAILREMHKAVMLYVAAGG